MFLTPLTPGPHFSRLAEPAVVCLLSLRLEGLNLLNHGNYLGRGQTVFGDASTPSTTFGQLAAVGTASSAIPAFANIDPPRMSSCRYGSFSKSRGVHARLTLQEKRDVIPKTLLI